MSAFKLRCVQSIPKTFITIKAGQVCIKHCSCSLCIGFCLPCCIGNASVFVLQQLKSAAGCCVGDTWPVMCFLCFETLDDEHLLL